MSDGRFSGLLDIIASPGAIFSRLRQQPRWLGALVAIILLTLVGAYLNGPAQHYADTSELRGQFTTTTYYLGYSRVGKQSLVDQTMHPPLWHDLVPAAMDIALGAIGALIIAALFLVLSKPFGNASGFRSVWSGALHVAIISTGVTVLVTGIVTLVVGADHFTSYSTLGNAIPDLAMVFPGASGAVGAGLGAITPFSLWAMVLLAIMGQNLVGLSKRVAWAVAVAILLAGAVLQGVLSLL